jgi:hypothetical protein
MAIQLSPSVSFKETDLTNVVPAVATSIGAAVIEAGWGPVQEVTTIDSENSLVAQFGKPNDLNSANWFAAANFLAYSNNLLIVRADTTRQRNAVSTLTGTVSSIPVATGGSNYASATVAIGAPNTAGQIAPLQILSGGVGYISAPAVSIAAPASGTQATATAVLGTGATAGQVVSIIMGNSGSGYLTAPVVTLSGGGFTTVATLATPIITVGGIQATADVVVVGGSVTEVVVTNPGSGYYTVPTATLNGVAVSGQVIANATLGAVELVSGGIKINGLDQYTASYENGEGFVGEFAAKYPGSVGNSIRVSMADAASFATWEYKGFFASAPGTSTYTASRGGVGDELHIVIVDKDSKWTGVAGTVMEKFEYVSKASDGKKDDGSSAYYRTVLKEQSQYVWNMDHPAVAANWGIEAGLFVFTSIGATAVTRDMAGGVDHFISTTGQRIGAFSLFSNDEELDVSLLIAGKANATIANYLIQNLAEVRKDCLAFISPEDVGSGSILVGNTSAVAAKIIGFRNALPSSSYFVMDSGYKYQYDRYADKYRWVPLNGDIAGLCARTDETNDPWYSPAGLTRGSIKNVVKLAYSPNKTDRDNLYKSGINPVVSFPGQGVILYGDKTGLTKPSAFDRINVRRLFIVLQKAIATAAKYQLFQFNDVQTRSEFVAAVEPFLRDVKGRRGIYEFKVICDTSNNTPAVIDGNRFVASIFISPARSINFIELNFVATRTGVSFEEIAGSV